jgi:hypothetical protein
MADFNTITREQPERRLFWAILVLPAALYLGTLCGMKLRRRSRAVQPDIMARRAAREFFRQYRKSSLTCRELLQLIRDFLNHRFGLSYGSLTPQEAVKILIERGVAPDTAEKLNDIMQQLENAEYTGKGMETAAVDTDFVKVIKRIEKESR